MPCDSFASRATSASVVLAKPRLAIESIVASISCTRRVSLMSLRAIAASRSSSLRRCCYSDAGLDLVVLGDELLLRVRWDLLIEVCRRKHAVEIRETHLLDELRIDEIEALPVRVAVAEVLDQVLAAIGIEHGIEEVVGLVLGAGTVRRQRQAADPGEHAFL